MTGKTSIEWATAVWNPTTGCTRVSAGCDNCYAFALHDKRHKANRDAAVAAGETMGPAGIGMARRAGARIPWPKQYDLPFSRVQLLQDRLDEPLRWRTKQRVFVDSMADLFHEDVPIKYLAWVFNTMASVRYVTDRRTGEREADPAAPVHDYLILTKRPDRMRWAITMDIPEFADEYMAGDCALNVMREVEEWPLPNVWLGTSVEDQATADARIPDLLATPAAVRFLSCEPLLGPVEIRRWLADVDGSLLDGPRLDWVIVGGESGPRARPMDLAWARSLVEQCRAAGMPCFVKQLGRWPIDTDRSVNKVGSPLHDRKGGDMAEWPDDLRVREFPR